MIDSSVFGEAIRRAYREPLSPAAQMAEDAERIRKCIELADANGRTYGAVWVGFWEVFLLP